MPTVATKVISRGFHFARACKASDVTLLQHHLMESRKQTRRARSLALCQTRCSNGRGFLTETIAAIPKSHLEGLMQYLNHRLTDGTAVGFKIWIQLTKSAVRGCRRYRESPNPAPDPLREAPYDSHGEALNVTRIPVTRIPKPSRRSVSTRRLADLPAVKRPPSELAIQGPKSIARNTALSTLLLRFCAQSKPKNPRATDHYTHASLRTTKMPQAHSKAHMGFGVNLPYRYHGVTYSCCQETESDNAFGFVHRKFLLRTSLLQPTITAPMNVNDVTDARPGGRPANHLACFAFAGPPKSTMIQF